MDPNSQNQMWSRWVFIVHAIGRKVSYEDVKTNAARWIRLGFGSTGVCRVSRTPDGWKIEAKVEGVPAHDPKYVEHVKLEFNRNFVAKGWGPVAWGTVHSRVLAGSLQDGKSAPQWVEIPTIPMS